MYLIGWFVFYLSHSLLLHPPVRGFLMRISGLGSAPYRLAYTLLSVVLFGGAVWLTRAEPSGALPLPIWLRYPGIVLAAAGLWITRDAFKAYDPSVFIGLKEEATPGLNISGWNARVRHPLYLGTILLLLALPLITQKWSWLWVTLLSFAYLVVGIWLEERKLLRTFGEDYRRYQKSVPAIFPKIKHNDRRPAQ